jgi:hypothetical protein
MEHPIIRAARDAADAAELEVLRLQRAHATAQAAHQDAQRAAGAAVTTGANVADALAAVQRCAVEVDAFVAAVHQAERTHAEKRHAIGAAVRSAAALQVAEHEAEALALAAEVQADLERVVAKAVRCDHHVRAALAAAQVSTPDGSPAFAGARHASFHLGRTLRTAAAAASGPYGSSARRDLFDAAGASPTSVQGAYTVTSAVRDVLARLTS